MTSSRMMRQCLAVAKIREALQIQALFGHRGCQFDQSPALIPAKSEWAQLLDCHSRQVFRARKSVLYPSWARKGEATGRRQTIQ